MKLTPLDIRHREFRRAMRGYSDEDVDVFLDEVADAFESLFQENMEARERIDRLEEQIGQYESLKEALQKTLLSAQQQADDTKSNARKEAELILKDAEIRGRDLLGESYGEKRRVQQDLIQLKQVEEDFRFKFRSLLEAHLNLLAEDEISGDRQKFRSLVAGVETALARQGSEAPAEGRPAAAAAPEIVSAGGERAGAVGVATSPVNVSSAEVAGRVSAAIPSTTAARPVEESDSYLQFDDETDDDLAILDDPDEHETDSPKDSSVRRFLFGRKDRAGEDKREPPHESDDREFQW